MSCAGSFTARPLVKGTHPGTDLVLRELNGVPEYDLLLRPGADLALVDVERALALRPNHAEGLLERGILHRLRDNKAGARQDWLKVLRVAPDSPAANAARQNLENMDVKTGK